MFLINSFVSKNIKNLLINLLLFYVIYLRENGKCDFAVGNPLVFSM